MSHLVTMALTFLGLGAALNLLCAGEFPGACQPRSGMLVCTAQKRGGFFEEPGFSVSLLICSWATSQQVWMAEEHFQALPCPMSNIPGTATHSTELFCHSLSVLFLRAWCVLACLVRAPGATEFLQSSAPSS